VKKILAKRYSCKHEQKMDYSTRVNWTYFHVPELDQYTESGHYETPCCNSCFEAWTVRAEREKGVTV
jgi:hypothetical protein